MKPSPSPAATEEAIAEVSRWLNDIEHLLTQERRSFEMETAWDHDWARTMREERVRPIFDALLSLIAASRGTRALTELGTRIKYKPGGKYPEWERGDFYYAGTTVQLHGPNRGEPNLWVADCWPIQSPGNITDGFSPDEWEPSA